MFVKPGPLLDTWNPLLWKLPNTALPNERLLLLFTSKATGPKICVPSPTKSPVCEPVEIRFPMLKVVAVSMFPPPTDGAPMSAKPNEPRPPAKALLTLQTAIAATATKFNANFFIKLSPKQSKHLVRWMLELTQLQQNNSIFPQKPWPYFWLNVFQSPAGFSVTKRRLLV